MVQVENFGNQLKSDLHKYQDSLLYTKTVMPSARTEEDGIAQVYKNFILGEAAPKGEGEQPPMQALVDAFNTAKSEAAMQPRLISVGGFQSVFELALENSKLRYRQDHTDEEIRLLKEEIAALKVRDQELDTKIDKLDEKTSQERQAMQERQEETNNGFTKQFSDAFR